MGLWGKPEKDGKEYLLFEIEGHPEILCHIEKAVLEWLNEAKASSEGDYLFMVEGVGRLRFCLV